MDQRGPAFLVNAVAEKPRIILACPRVERHKRTRPASVPSPPSAVGFNLRGEMWAPRLVWRKVRGGAGLLHLPPWAGLRSARWSLAPLWAGLKQPRRWVADIRTSFRF